MSLRAGVGARTVGLQLSEGALRREQMAGDPRASPYHSRIARLDNNCRHIARFRA